MDSGNSSLYIIQQEKLDRNLTYVVTLYINVNIPIWKPSQWIDMHGVLGSIEVTKIENKDITQSLLFIGFNN
jgi:hypothetical protein